MYGGRTVQYGWQQNGPPRNPNVIELPLAPVRQRSAGASCNNCLNWYSFGVILCLLAASSLALGIADVVLTHQTYMVEKNCKDMTTPSYCDPNNLVFTWVASGIWGSFVVFVFGIYAIYKGSRPYEKLNWFDLLAFLSAFVFTPAIVVLSAVEVYKGANVYYWSAMDLPKDDLAKAIIPIVIAGLGFIEHVMCFIAISYICCCTAKPVSQYDTGRVVVGQTTVIRTPQQCNTCPAPQGPYDRPYNIAKPGGSQQIYQTSFPGASSFYAPRTTTTYNHYTGANGISQFRSGTPNPAYSFFKA